MKWLSYCVLLLSAPVMADECVILLHGLARSDASMARMAVSLKEVGYQVVNVSYPSTKKDIAALAEEAVTEGLKKCPDDAAVNFVTHSLGGILVRHYLQGNTIESLNRVVMLGPPNGGSQVVDKLRNVPGLTLANGLAGMELGAGDGSVPKQLAPVDFELGIIAGTRTVNPILSTMLPNPDDGKVSVESTRVAGMNDHIQLPVTHTFMMRNSKVIEQVIHYLENGQFKRLEEPDSR